MNMLRILLDLSVNGGWNGVAIGFYSIAAVLILTAFIERKRP